MSDNKHRQSCIWKKCSVWWLDCCIKKIIGFFSYMSFNFESCQYYHIFAEKFFFYWKTRPVIDFRLKILKVIKIIKIHKSIYCAERKCFLVNYVCLCIPESSKILPYPHTVHILSSHQPSVCMKIKIVHEITIKKKKNWMYKPF